MLWVLSCKADRGGGVFVVCDGRLDMILEDQTEVVMSAKSGCSGLALLEGRK